MAARLNPSHDQRTRDKIQTSQIINRLNSFVNGKIEMTGPQVTAGLGLLKKCLPDLQATEMKHDVSDALADLMKEIDGRGRGLPDNS